MALRIREFSSLSEVEFFLRGGVRGGPVKLESGLIQKLHGKTFNPGSLVTFDETAGAAGLHGGLTVAEVISQITAANAGLLVRYAERGFYLVESSPSSGVTVSKDGTANPLLGFSSSTDSSNVVYAAPSDAAPRIVFITGKVTSDGYVVTVDEA